METTSLPSNPTNTVVSRSQCLLGALSALRNPSGRLPALGRHPHKRALWFSASIRLFSTSKSALCRSRKVSSALAACRSCILVVPAASMYAMYSSAARRRPLAALGTACFIR